MAKADVLALMEDSAKSIQKIVTYLLWKKQAYF